MAKYKTQFSNTMQMLAHQYNEAKELVTYYNWWEDDWVQQMLKKHMGLYGVNILVNKLVSEVLRDKQSDDRNYKIIKTILTDPVIISKLSTLSKWYIFNFLMDYHIYDDVDHQEILELSKKLLETDFIVTDDIVETIIFHLTMPTLPSHYE